MPTCARSHALPGFATRRWNTRVPLSGRPYTCVEGTRGGQVVGAWRQPQQQCARVHTPSAAHRLRTTEAPPPTHTHTPTDTHGTQPRAHAPCSCGRPPTSRQAPAGRQGP
jgi:hypothetical protein